ncbi:MAG: hypothetical protein ACI8UR_002115, partial [Natronomonas sp.]
SPWQFFPNPTARALSTLNETYFKNICIKYGFTITFGRY